MADSNAKAPEKQAPAGLSWGHPSQPKPTAASGTPSTDDPDVKGLFGRASAAPPPPPAGITAVPSASVADAGGESELDPVSALFRASGPLRVPPAPIFAPEAEGQDPVATLFSQDSAVRAPDLAAKPRAAEPRRPRTSLFDNTIREPAAAPPPAGVAPAKAAAPVPEPIVARPAVATSVSDAPAMPDVVRDPAPFPARPAPPPLAQQADPAQEPRRARQKARPDDAEPQPPPPPPPARAREREAAAEAPQPRAPRRGSRFERSPSRLTLALLAFAALLSLGSALALLGVLPNPFAKATLPAEAGVAAPSPTAARGALAAGTKPGAAPPPAAPAPLAAAPSQAKLPAAPVAKPAPPSAPAATAPHAPDTSAATKPAAARPEPAPPKPELPAAAPPAPKSSTAAEASSSESGDEGADSVLRLARKKLAEDDAAGAEALLRAALAKDPRDHHAMELLARALMDQDRGKEALVFARKIVERRPKRASYRLLLGDLLLMVGDEKGARSEWEEARKIAPDDPQIRRRLSGN